MNTLNFSFIIMKKLEFTSNANILNFEALGSAIITRVTKIIVETIIGTTNTNATATLSPVKRTRLFCIASNQDCEEEVIN